MTDGGKGPGARSELLRTIRPWDLEIPLLGSAAFYARGRALVGDERVRYDGIVGDRLQVVERGADGTAAATWRGGTPVLQIAETQVPIDPAYREPTEADVGDIRLVRNVGTEDALNVVLHGADGSLITKALNLLDTGRAQEVSYALKWGAFGSGAGQFTTAEYVAVDDASGLVFTTDSNRHRFVAYTNGGTYYGEFGSFGGGTSQFQYPEGIAVDPTTRDIYVVSWGERLIKRYNASWVWQNNIGADLGAFLWGVAVDAAGNVYVADQNATSQTVLKYAKTGGLPLAQFGVAGGGNGAGGAMARPTGVAVNRTTGDLYVCDLDNHYVQRFSSAGAWLGRFGGYGNGDGQLNNPYGVAVGPLGNVWVTDQGNHRVQKFDAAGNFLAKFGSHGSGNGSFNFPTGIAMSAAGDALYVVDTGRVQKFLVGTDGQVPFLAGTTTTTDGGLSWDNALKRLKAGAESGLARLVGGVLRAASPVQRTLNQTIANNTDGDWTVACAAGEVVTGGGCYNGGITGTNNWFSGPSGQGWRCVVRNATGASVTATAYAVCIPATS